MKSMLTISAAGAMAHAGIACREHTGTPLLASRRVRPQGTGVSIAAIGAGTDPQLTSMDVTCSRRGRPAV